MRRLAYFIAGVAAGLLLAISIERLRRPKVDSSADSVETLPASFEAFEWQQADNDMQHWRMIANQLRLTVEVQHEVIKTLRAKLRRVTVPATLKPPALEKLRLN